MTKKKIFCFNNDGKPGCYYGMAMAEDGTVLAEHICSSKGFMKHDLGLTSDWKHDQYNHYYGAGSWELEFVDDPKTHEGLQKAYKLNQEMRKNAESESS